MVEYSLGGTYNTGTLSVVNGGTTVTITGALLTTQALQGDKILIAGLFVYVDTVVDDDTITIDPPWSGATQVDVDYVLLKDSWQRYEPALLQAKVRDLLAFYKGVGFFYFVEGAEPDPGQGTDGQFAIKVNSGPWKIWYMVDGLWVYQGAATELSFYDEWDSATTYVINDIVPWQGSLYQSLVGPNLNHQPDLSPTQWRLILSGGDRYDIQFFDTDRPVSGELVNKMFPTGVVFHVGLTTSYASAETASTDTAVYHFKKNGTDFATLTFSAGNPVGVWSCPVETTFGTGDKFTQIAPNPRDATLAGVGGQIIGYRTT